MAPVSGPGQRPGQRCRAMLAGDQVMSHSLLSSSLDLGLIDPAEVVGPAEDAWRENVGHAYWHFGEDYAHRNALGHRTPLPDWFL